MWTFIESPSFSAALAELWTDAEFGAFQQFLGANPQKGDVIPGMGGLRKVRWAARGKGKRGGARVVYLLLLPPGIIYLFYIYTKGEMTDLNSEQKRRLLAAIAEVKAQFQL